jgi:hypothetical protein
VRWLAGTAVVVGILLLGVWYFSLEHLDPITRAVERELEVATTACEKTAADAAPGSSPAIGPGPAIEESHSCWREIGRMRVDVRSYLSEERQTAVRQLKSWGWIVSGSLVQRHSDSPLQSASFYRSLGPKPGYGGYGCSRHYELALYATADGQIVRADAHQPEDVFTICS